MQRCSEHTHLCTTRAWSKSVPSSGISALLAEVSPSLTAAGACRGAAGSLDLLVSATVSITALPAIAPNKGPVALGERTYGEDGNPYSSGLASTTGALAPFAAARRGLNLPRDITTIGVDVKNLISACFIRLLVAVLGS